MERDRARVDVAQGSSAIDPEFYQINGSMIDQVDQLPSALGCDRHSPTGWGLREYTVDRLRASIPPRKRHTARRGPQLR